MSKLEKKCVTIPTDLVKWAKAEAKKDRSNFSRIVVEALMEKKESQKQ